MRKRRPQEGFVKQEDLEKTQEKLTKREKSLRVSRGFVFLFSVLFIVSSVLAVGFSLELYHWNPFETLELGFTTSVSNVELKNIANSGRKVSIYGYITTGYNNDIFLDSKPYTVPYYLGSDEMALYRNIALDVTSIGGFREGDLVKATGYLTYDNFISNINGNTYSYKIKLTNPTFEACDKELGSYYNEYKKFQDTGAMNIIAYATTWMDYVITGCYYETYDGIEVLDTEIFNTCTEAIKGVDSELKEEYLAAINTLKDSIDRCNLLVEAKDYSTIVAEMSELYQGFDKFDMITASVDISDVI